METEYLYLYFRMYRDGKVELLPSFHLPGPVLPSDERPQATVAFDLLDEAGQILTFHRCHLEAQHQDSDAPYLEFHEIVPWDARAQSITFQRYGEAVDTVELEEAPNVSKPTFRADRNDRRKREREEEGLLRVSWDGQHPDTERNITYLLRYSHDGGNTWRVVATDLTEPHHEVNLDFLPGGERCKIQVVASVGIQTAVAHTDLFTVRQKRRQAYILSPEPNATFREEEPVVLRGVGFSPDFGTAAFRDLVWTSNLDGVLGVGYEVITSALSAGRHRISLAIPDGLEEESSASVYIVIKEDSASTRRIGKEALDLFAPTNATVRELPQVKLPQQLETPTPDITTQIRKLAELKEEGILTEAEFQKKKRDLLDRI